MVKIVLVVTSAGELSNGHPTGLWLEECAAPYYHFKEAGYEVVLASPAGGACPIDQGSLGEGFFTAASKKFLHDAEAVGMLSHTAKLDTIDLETVDCLYMAGGHGTCVDFINNPTLKAAIEQVYHSGDKVVAAACHGPICLAECTKSDGTTPLVQGLTVTGFTDSEEDAVQLTSAVPFLIETRFKEQGAKYEKAADWHSKVCVDGKLITGQNPQSSDECAKAVIQLISA